MEKFRNCETQEKKIENRKKAIVRMEKVRQNRMKQRRRKLRTVEKLLPEWMS